MYVFSHLCPAITASTFRSAAVWAERLQQWRQVVMIEELLRTCGFGGISGAGSGDSSTVFGHLRVRSVRTTSRDKTVVRWKRYYCRVTDGYLSYFAPRGNSKGNDAEAVADAAGKGGGVGEDGEQRKPKGIVPIGNRTIVHLETKLIKSGYWAFSVTTAMRSVIFRAPNAQTCWDWLDKILDSVGIPKGQKDQMQGQLERAEAANDVSPSFLREANCKVVFVRFAQLHAFHSHIRMFAVWCLSLVLRSACPKRVRGVILLPTDISEPNSELPTTVLTQPVFSNPFASPPLPLYRLGAGAKPQSFRPPAPICPRAFKERPRN